MTPLPAGNPTVVVLYDHGAATPFEIIGATRGLCNVVYAYDTKHNRHVQKLERLLTRLPHLDLTDLSAAEIIAAVSAHHPDAIVTYSAHQLARAAALNEALALRGHGKAAIPTLIDKWTQRCALVKAGDQPVRAAPVRNACDLPEAVASLGLPAVLKPRVGTGSRGVRRLHTSTDAVAAADTLDNAIDREFGYLLEELLVGDPAVAGPQWGDYVSVESWVQGDAIVHLGITGKLPLVDPFCEQGGVMPSTLSAEMQVNCEQVAARSISALGIRTGLVHTELKLTADGPRVIEVNPRLGGGVAPLYKEIFGIDLIYTAMRNALGFPAPTIKDPTGVAVWYMAVPPVGAHGYRSIRGLDEIRSLPGIISVTLLKHAGELIDRRDGAESRIVMILWRADNHSDAFITWQKIQELLVIEWIVLRNIAIPM